MFSKNEYDLLLFPVFDYLRRHGVPLGLEEYLLAINTLRKGGGLHDDTGPAYVNHLKTLCRLLWAKSKEDQKLCNMAFDRFVKPRLHVPFSEIGPQKITQEKDPSPGNKQQPQVKREEKEENEQTTPSPEQQDTHEPETPSEPFHDNVSERHSLTPRPSSDDMTDMQASVVEEPFDLPLSLQGQPSSDEIFVTYTSPKYNLTPYLPLGRREIAGIWRHLRRFQRTGAPEELDVKGTIDNICNIGFFLKPVLRPRKRNQARLLLFIDQQGSMAPFQLIVHTLTESILHSGLLGGVEIYYFHDYPANVIYERKNLTKARPLEKVLTHQLKDSSVLIVSDAGAARGDYDGDRIKKTQNFLKELHQYTYLYAWLNPMPSTRWTTTTAERIARVIPMFDLSREGLNDAVNILRGHPFPAGVNIDAAII